MSGAAKISIIIPVYNVKPYLSKCLESCLQQTLYDIEIICVDDGSTDGSGELLDEYANMDSRIQVIHKENNGVSRARNTGLESATGEWIMYVDADDYLSENACERVWLESMEEPTDIITFGADCFPTVPKAGAWYDYALNVQFQRFYKFEPEVLFEAPGARPFIWHQAFSHELLRTADVRFNEKLSMGEDQVYQIELFPMAEKFAFIPDQLYHYRWCREDSAMGQLRNEPDAKMEQHLLMVEEITRYWQEKGLLDQYGPEYLEWLLNFMVPDMTHKDLERAGEHARSLRGIIENYGLEQKISGQRLETKALWRKLNKLCR